MVEKLLSWEVSEICSDAKVDFVAFSAARKSAPGRWALRGGSRGLVRPTGPAFLRSIPTWNLQRQPF